MTEHTTLRDYTFFGEDIDLERVERAHDMVCDWHDRFLEDHAIQDLLLADGYEIEDGKRPTSYHDLHDATWIRVHCSLHLGTIQYFTKIATEPPGLLVPKPVVAGPEASIVFPADILQQPLVRMETAEGIDAEQIARFQEQWTDNQDIVPAIRAHETALSTAWDEFNRKFILDRMRQAQRPFIPPEFETVAPLRRQLDETLDGPTYGALDTAYYTRARALLGACGRTYKPLAAHAFGKQFVLTIEELRQGVDEIRSERRGSFYG